SETNPPCSSNSILKAIPFAASACATGIRTKQLFWSSCKKCLLSGIGRQPTLSSNGVRMTPEERLTKIENAIQALAEVQGSHDAKIQALIEAQTRHEGVIEKQNAGIRDLIVVRRTLVDCQ